MCLMTESEALLMLAGRAELLAERLQSLSTKSLGTDVEVPSEYACAIQQSISLARQIELHVIRYSGSDD